jgi:hypothetical protein
MDKFAKEILDNLKTKDKVNFFPIRFENNLEQ